MSRPIYEQQPTPRRLAALSFADSQLQRRPNLAAGVSSGAVDPGRAKWTGTIDGGPVATYRGFIVPSVQLFGNWGGEGYEFPFIYSNTIADGADSFTPFLVPSPIHVDTVRVGTFQDTNSGGVFRAAIYAADLDWQPESLVWDSGEQTTDTGYYGVFDIAADINLPAGRYLEAICWSPDNDAVFAAWFTLDMLESPYYNYIGGGVPGQGGGLPFLGIDGSPFVNPGAGLEPLPIWAIMRSRAYGAFPDPGSPWDTAYTTVTPANDGIPANVTQGYPFLLGVT